MKIKACVHEKSTTVLYSIESLMNASTIIFTLAKFNQETKYMLQVAKEVLAKVQTKTTKHQNDVNVIFVFI